MTKLNLSADEVLTTTRAVRKRLDFERPVELSVIKDCLEIAIQAPSGSNSQGWSFMLVTDEKKKSAIAEIYQKSFADYINSPMQPTAQHKDDPAMADIQTRVQSSAQYLADNIAKVPAMLIPCFSGRTDAPPMSSSPMQAGIYGSLLPAVWSFMLAARERGIGTCWTTLHLVYEQEVADILGIPFDSVTQVALIPIAYTKGTDFKSGGRKALASALHINDW